MRDLKELAKLVRVKRAELGLSQEELAKKAGVSFCSVSFIETSKKVPRVSTLVKIAKALETDQNELLKYLY